MSLEDSSSDTECAICFSNYDNVFKLPKVLYCGHTFCLECLARINISAEVPDSILCPICRNYTKVPEGKGLPALDNNQDVLSSLPASLQHAQSVRFSRDKGCLYVNKLFPPSFLKAGQISTVSLSLDLRNERPPPQPLPSRILNSRRCILLIIFNIVLLVAVTLVIIMVGSFTGQQPPLQKPPAEASTDPDNNFTQGN
ncbi:RING finger protein 225-like [Protopterus annectens]|uniref:RING finger protein 225-like n=1 Tax=Protopterus annectens TaxID=7888 RepID=UPI001CFBBAAE|nr:RING finger protein 225-like [Protopterus annectens]